MALDLSMLSSRRSSQSPSTVHHHPSNGYGNGHSYGTTDADTYGRPGSNGCQEVALALVTKKRVRFQDHGARPAPFRVGPRGWSRAPRETWSNEENGPPTPSTTTRPPTGGAAAASGGAASSTTGGSAPAAEFDSRLSTSSDHQTLAHPAAVTGHMTVPDHRPSIDHLPSDPRDWSRVDVAAWLTYMRTMHPVLEALHPNRFLMNGKALCLMSPNMFSYRVPQGGSTLFRDFRARLSRALAETPSTTGYSVTSTSNAISAHTTTTTMTLPTVVSPS